MRVDRYATRLCLVHRSVSIIQPQIFDVVPAFIFPGFSKPLYDDVRNDKS